MRACFTAVPLPVVCAGVAPKVCLGVTLGPHEICLFWEQLVGLLVLDIFAGAGADRVGPFALAWLRVVGPDDLTVGVVLGVFSH